MYLADDGLDEGGAGGLLSLAVRGTGGLGDDGGRVTLVEAPGEVCVGVIVSTAVLPVARGRRESGKGEGDELRREEERENRRGEREADSLVRAAAIVDRRGWEREVKKSPKREEEEKERRGEGLRVESSFPLFSSGSSLVESTSRLHLHAHHAHSHTQSATYPLQQAHSSEEERRSSSEKDFAERGRTRWQQSTREREVGLARQQGGGWTQWCENWDSSGLRCAILPPRTRR
jgi:hypothetical protein